MPPKNSVTLWSPFGGKIVSGGRDGFVFEGPEGMVFKQPRRVEDDTQATGYRDEVTVPFFEHERAMYAMLQQRPPPHPNILQSVLSTSDYVFLPRMKETLKDVLERPERASDDGAARWLVQIASAAAWLESMDYFHGDLRPPNILLDAAGNVKLCDFGNMARRGEENNGPTLPYYKDDTLGPASEQYAIGSLMYALFAGHELLHDVDDYPTKHKMLRGGQVPPVEHLRAGHVIRDCWAGRYSSLEQLHGVLLVELGLGPDYQNPAVCLTPDECAAKAAACEAWGEMRLSRRLLTVANYSVDEEIASFFDKTTTTREACDAFAARLGGRSTPVDIQGVCSYTVFAGPQSELVVQFRLQSLKLSLETTQAARRIYGDFVPRVECRGPLGEDGVAEDKPEDANTKGAKEPLLVYVMDRIPGITYLDFVLAHSAEVPEASPGFAPWRMELTRGVAKFFALSWKTPQALGAAEKQALQARHKSELELLQRALPARFGPVVQRALAALPAIFSTLPTVLLHRDFGVCNVLVDGASCALQGVVDWAEAEVAPFGLNLHSYQRFLGAVHLRTGWGRYGDSAAAEEAFWDTFCRESGTHDPHVIQTIKAARVVGLLLSLGFTSRLANETEPTPIQDDEAGAYKMRDPDGLLIRPETRIRDEFL